jgi:hypothetical protein
MQPRLRQKLHHAQQRPRVVIKQKSPTRPELQRGLQQLQEEDL